MKDPVSKLNTKPIQHSQPVPIRHVLFLANISKCRVEQFAQCLIAWKRSTVFCNLAQSHVHRLSGIGSVNNFTNLLWIVKERNYALPVAPPALHNGQIVFSSYSFKYIHGL
jgi:hypothetical protein